MRCVTNCSRLRRANCKPNKPGVTRLEPLYAKEQARLYSVQGWQRRRLNSKKAPTPEKCSAAANLSCRQSCIAAAVDLAQRRFKI